MSQSTNTQTTPLPPASELPTMAPATTYAPMKQHRSRRGHRILRLVLVALIALAYGGGAYYFSKHFVPRTSVDNIDAGNMTPAELSEALTRHAAAYTQHVTGGDGFELTLTSADLGLTFDADRVATEAMDRTHPLLWPLSLVAPQRMLIDGNMQLDDERVAQMVGQAVAAYNEQATPPTNASAHYDTEQDAFVISSEAVGTALDVEPVIKECAVAARELREDVAVPATALTQPAVTSEDEQLNASVEQANALLSHGMEVQADGATVLTVDHPTLAGWIRFDDERKLSIAGVGDWVNSSPELADAGNAIDDEHVWGLDAAGTTAAITDALNASSEEPVQLVRTALETKPPVTPGAKERGRHIDINLTTQFCRFYDESGKVVWDSYCVTGGYDPEYGDMHDTPTGTFAIEAKETNRTLIGIDRNNDGKPDYESFVYYWMPFLAGDWGLHDATWRADFGGDIRYWWGSHGCVNLPYEKAEQLYNMINVGDTVYIHYSEDEG